MVRLLMPFMVPYPNPPKALKSKPSARNPKTKSKSPKASATWQALTLSAFSSPEPWNGFVPILYSLASFNWVAVKELTLDYHVMGT